MTDAIIRSRLLTRRGALGGLVLGGAASACAAGSTPAGVAAAPPGVCMLTPEVTEGPYYFDPALERADIRENKNGVPVKLNIRVLDASCQPMRGARVDIWHCDAGGLYSGYAGQDGVSTIGQKFLRGHQLTSADGDVSFTTVYPGWYHGRTTHIHQKVYIGERNVLTAQIFLPDALSEWIYANAPDYRRSDTRDMLNADDEIAHQQGYSTYGAVKEEADHYSVSLTLGVDPNHVSQERGPPGGPMGGPPGGGPPPGMRPPNGRPPPGDARARRR